MQKLKALLEAVKKYKSKEGVYYWAEMLPATMWSGKKPVYHVVSQMPGYPATAETDDWFPDLAATDKIAQDMAKGKFDEGKLGEADDAVVRQYINRIVNKEKKDYARAYWAWKQGGEEGAEPAHPNLSTMGAQAVRIAIAGILKEDSKQEMSLKSDDEIFSMFKKEYDAAVKQKLPPNPFAAAFTKTVIAARIRKPDLEKILKDNGFKAEGAWSLMSEPAREGWNWTPGLRYMLIAKINDLAIGKSTSFETSSGLKVTMTKVTPNIYEIERELKKGGETQRGQVAKKDVQATVKDLLSEAAAFRKTPADQQAADFRKIMKDKQRKAPTDIPESRLAAVLAKAEAL